MGRSLYGKLALSLFLLILLIGAVLLSVVRFSSEMYHQEVAQKLNSEVAAYMAQEFPLITARRANPEALERLFQDLMILNPSIEVYLLAPDGRLMAHAAPAEHIRRERVDLGPVLAFVAGEQRFPLLGDDPRDPDGHKVFSAAPVHEQGELQGYLYVILASQAHDSIADALGTSYALRLGAWGLGGSLAAALLAGLLLFGWLTRRLGRLARRMEQVGVALPDTPANDDGDELDRLERHFDRMARKIRRQLAELTDMDNRRREMVANVSHDLRTPLATLHGYLETLLLKGDELPPGQRQQYLRTAVRNSEDLARLVEQLFELARLDAGDAPTHTEAFAVNELIQDTLLKYRLTAQEKDIGLEVDCAPGLPFVQADIALIQRALDNLIENALRHTPEGGSIVVSLTPRDGKVDVAISDTGCGIPSSDLARVFERFYRRDKSREAGPAHAGLGLAIARRIVELHGAAIRADSTVGEGTTFSFALPCPASGNPASG